MFAKILISYVLTLVAYAAIDFLWLGLLMKNFYRNGIGHLMAPGFNYLAAGVFYLLYTLGLFFFAIYPGYLKESIATAALLGACLGLFAYATYDLSNLATLRNWPLSITIVDILWGMGISAISASIGVFILQIIQN